MNSNPIDNAILQQTITDILGEPVRMCGVRKMGMVYIINNKPSRAQREEKAAVDLRHILLCPVWQPWNEIPGGTPAMFGLAAQGMLILERRDANGKGLGVWDIYDWVGLEYPTVPDFYTEMCYFGTSRLIPRNSQFGLLTPESYHFFAHARAKLVEPLEPFYRDRHLLMECPSKSELHNKPDLKMGIFDSCTGLLWEAVGFQKKDEPRLHRVELPPVRPKDQQPSCVYDAVSIPTGVMPIFEPGIWGADGISHLEIIIDPYENKHIQAAEFIEKSGCQLPYTFMEE